MLFAFNNLLLMVNYLGVLVALERLALLVLGMMNVAAVTHFLISYNIFLRKCCLFGVCSLIQTIFILVVRMSRVQSAGDSCRTHG